MVIIFLYLAGLLILGVFSLLVTYNYWRYRLEGDHTRTILAVFFIAFVLIAISGLTMVRVEGSSDTNQTAIDSF